MNIIKSVTSAVSKTKFKAQKHSPEILIVTGVVGVVASGVLACKATLKVNDILDEAKRDVESVHETLENEEFSQQYTQEDANKDLATIYVQTGFKFIKLYGPSVALGIVSILSILTSNNILRKRYLATAAAYTALDKGFKEYRGRVIDRFGEEIDKELKYGIVQKKISETIVDEETGKEKTVKKTVSVIDPNAGYSPYAFFFDEYSPEWKDDAELNKAFLIGVQTYLQNQLISRGYVTLNQARKELGVGETAMGNVVGWAYDPENPNHNGDGYIDLGIFDGYRETVRDFVNGYEKCILLDPNVDGNILWAIDKFGPMNRW